MKIIKTMKDYHMNQECPNCGSTNCINTYRHPHARVWCTTCDFELREEGSQLWNELPAKLLSKSQERRIAIQKGEQ